MPTKFLAISVKQPWAALLVAGVKTVEVRTWATRARGPVLIHAAKTADDRPEGWALVNAPELQALAALRGGIIGRAGLASCVRYRTAEAFVVNSQLTSEMARVVSVWTNRLAKAGAEVLHQEIAAVHVSGHACSEEMRTMLALLRPKAVMPIHGEYRMQAAHAQLARDAGVPAEGIVIAENGSVVELSSRGARIVDRIAAGVTFVDGLGVGDVQDVALRDRRRLSEDGVLIVVTTVALSDGVEIAPPELIARGMGEDEELLADLRAEAQRVVSDLAADGITEIKLLQEHLHDEVAQVVYAKTRRRPMILPIVIEV